MTKVLRVVSDTHLEFLEDKKDVYNWFNKVFNNSLFTHSKIDYLFLAGDICSLAPEHVDKLYRFLHLIVTILNPRKIVYVWGNHEYYATDWKKDEYYKEIVDRIHALSANGSIIYCPGKSPMVLDHEDIFLSTLWYPDTPDVWLLQNNLNDFDGIKNCTPRDFIEIHQYTVNLLKSFNKNTVPRVWCFHHLPTLFSLPSRYKTDRLSCYFASDLSNLISELQPDIVYHGHSHDSVEYYLGRTLIKSNPIGYPK